MSTTNSTEDLVGRYERWLQSWGAAQRTREARLGLATRILTLWPEPGTITTEDLGGFLGHTMSDWTRITYLGHLHSFFGWMTEVGVIAADPTLALRRPRSPGGKPKPLSPVEVRAVMAAATGNTRVWLQLAMYAGLRAHEIAKIRGEDVTEETIFVRGKGGKEEYLPTHPAIWAAAQDRPRKGWWFPSPQHDGHVSSDSITILVGRLFRSVGIPSGSIHRARHTYATTLLRRGANIRVVQGLMRHSSLATTALYTAVDEDERRAAVNLLGDAG